MLMQVGVMVPPYEWEAWMMWKVQTLTDHQTNQLPMQVQKNEPEPLFAMVVPSWEVELILLVWMWMMS
jgi:hypothetical protein